MVMRCPSSLLVLNRAKPSPSHHAKMSDHKGISLIRTPPPPLGPPEGPRYGPTVGSYGAVVSYERVIPVVGIVGLWLRRECLLSEARPFEQLHLSDGVRVNDNKAASGGGGVAMLTGPTLTATRNIEISRSVSPARD